MKALLLLRFLANETLILIKSRLASKMFAAIKKYRSPHIGVSDEVIAERLSKGLVQIWEASDKTNR